ncbi:MAG: chitobiase/beta-hexosaminidase C-terminal domain-containing protein, partial [Phycisphaerales bacterium]
LLYGDVGWWVELNFTGLDPGTDYTFATSACRGNPSYTNRWAVYTLTDADTYTNASTTGVDVLAENSVRFNTGDNYSDGFVARWTGITASDGSFTVLAEADPSSSESRKAYSFDVFMLEGGFQGTDVEDDMLGFNASLWMRTEFDLEEGESAIFDSLTLRMKYEDGFVAYLNGQPVAGKNAPDPVQWNSAALSDRPMEDASVFELINLTGYVNALQDGRNVLAIHGLNDSVTDPNFLILPELDAASNMTVPQYFTQPTPRRFNVSGAIGIVSDVWFSHERGFYDTGLQLILSTALDDAEIRYTTDGSRPTITHGNTYIAPIDVSSTSTIRAVAIKPGWLDSDVETHTYIFLDDVIAQSPNGEVPPGWPSSGVNGQTMQYGMDPAIVNDPVWGPQLKSALLAIPSMSIVTDLDNLFDPSIGIYVNAGYHGYEWERPTSLELIYPPNIEGAGFPDLVPVPDGAGGVRQGLSADMRGGFQIDAGIRIRGGFSRSDGNPKHAFRLFFRNEYGAGKLRYPLFGDEGVDGFDKVDLRTSQNYSWSFQNDSYNTLCRDVWARDTQGQMGQAYTRSRYYHVYINGQYWGVFQTQERPEAAYGASYFGGDRDEWDCVKATGPNAGYTIEATDGTLDDWQDLWELTNNLPGATVSQRTALYFQVQGLNTDGTRNPSYPVLLDVDNLIDYMIMVFYDGDLDAPVSWFLGNDRTNNWYGIRYRPGEEGFRYFVHDAEHIMKAAERTNGGVVNRTGPWRCGDQFQYCNPQWIHQRLMLVPEYRLRFADHAHKQLFNSGLLTTGEAIERFQARAAQIDLAIIAESARWGSASLNKNTWQVSINREVDNFFPTRAGTVVSHLRNAKLWDGGAVAPLYPSVSAPTFNQHGGEVASGFYLTINASSGTIYYTLDGSDPREPITGNPVGTQYGGQITLNKSTHVKARVLSGGTWSALNEAIFAIGPVADYLRITEIMYHPKGTGDPNDPNEEFIELKNIGKDTLSINLVRFTEGIDFTFPD